MRQTVILPRCAEPKSSRQSLLYSRGRKRATLLASLFRSGVSLTLLTSLVISGCGPSEPEVADATSSTSASGSHDASGGGHGSNSSSGSGGGSSSGPASFGAPGGGHSGGSSGGSSSGSGMGSSGPSAPGMMGPGSAGPGSAGPGSVGPGSAGGHDGGSSSYGSGSGSDYGMSGSGMGSPGGGFGNSGQGPGTSGGLFGGFDPMALADALSASKPVASNRFPSEYGTQAEMAFKQAYEKLAHELMVAHLALEPDVAAENGNYEKVRYSAMLKKPLWNLRWGMAISLRTPDDFDGEVDPITESTSGGSGGSFGGSEGPSGMGGMAGMGGMSGGRGANGGSVSVGSDSVSDIPAVLGLFADVSAEMFRKRFSNGDFGIMFSSLGPAPQPQTAGAGGTGGGGIAGGADSGGGFGGGGSGMGVFGGEDDDSSMGGPGMGAPGMGGPGMGAPGMGGPGMSGGSGMMGGQSGGRAASGMAAMMNQREPQRPRWQPGIVYLGKQELKDIVSVGKTAGVDVVLVFDVKVENRRDSVENETRARLVLVSDPKQTFASSKRLSNTDVKNRNRSGDADPKKMVEETLEPLFQEIDRKLAVRELPTLTREQAVARVSSLLADNSANSLEVMAEVQLYRSRGLLTDEDVLSASELLFGDDGIKLAAGSKSVRREVEDALQERLSEYGDIGLPEPNRPTPANTTGMGGFPGFGGMGSSGMGSSGMGPGGVGPGGVGPGGVGPGGLSSGGLSSGGPGSAGHDGDVDSGGINSGGISPGGMSAGGLN